MQATAQQTQVCARVVVLCWHCMMQQHIAFHQLWAMISWRNHVHLRARIIQYAPASDSNFVV
jgi:hypothetical protein